MNDTFTCETCGKQIFIISKTMHRINCTPLSPSVQRQNEVGAEAPEEAPEEESSPSGDAQDEALEELLAAPPADHEKDDDTEADCLHQKETEVEEWTCKACTLLNPVLVTHCTACDTPRLVLPSSAQSLPESAPVATTKDFTDSNGRSVRCRTIEVCLIRHAQSEQNVIFYDFLNMGISLFIKREWPDFPILQTTKKFLGLLGCDDDAELAELGKRQVKDMQMILQSNKFWTKQFPPDVCAWSPLVRARDTLYGILGNAKWEEAMKRHESGLDPEDPSAKDAEGEAENEGSSTSMPKFLCLDSLVEATPMEHVPTDYMRREFYERLDTFKNWMCNTAANDSIHRIVVCGHSQYFKTMLKQKVLFRNNDVQRASFTVEYDIDTKEIISGSWSQPTLLHRTQLAPMHPMDMLRGEAGHIGDATGDASRRKHTQATQAVQQGQGPGVIDDLTSDGTDLLKQCRICQTTNEEEPSLAHTFIRPCKCTGSQAFVHIRCLNQWRATSENAEKVCSVCKFHYRIRESNLVLFIKSNHGITLLTIVTIFVVSILLGMCVRWVNAYVRHETNNHQGFYDVASYLYEKMSLYTDKSVGNLYNTNGGPPFRHGRHNTNTRNSFYVWWRYCKEAKSSEHEQIFKMLSSHLPMTLLDKLYYYFYGFLRWLLSTTSDPPLPSRPAYAITSDQAAVDAGTNGIVYINSADDPREICSSPMQRDGNRLYSCIPSYNPTLLCNDQLSSTIDTMYLGVVLVAALGFLHFICSKLYQIWIFYRQTGRFDRNELMHIAMVGIGICAHSSSIGGRRVLAVFGAIFAFREMVYMTIRQVVFQKASRLGETILNYQID